MNFLEMLQKAARSHRSLLCIGLDPDPALMPEGDLLSFNKAIVDATSDLVCAYKPNLAFYEALGMEGLKALEKTVEHIPQEIPVIADAKRGDIGNTSRAYARALFDVWGFHAATVNPYLGFDSLEPFMEYPEKGVFILCKTSNQGSLDFQTRNLLEEGFPLYELVARKAREWNVRGNVGVVVGATFPQELQKIRELCTDMPILIPGIGAQGGDLASSVRLGVDARGEKAIISVSRQILYASKGKDFAQAARQAALKVRDEINQILATLKPFQE